MKPLSIIYEGIFSMNDGSLDDAAITAHLNSDFIQTPALTINPTSKDITIVYKNRTLEFKDLKNRNVFFLTFDPSYDIIKNHIPNLETIRVINGVLYINNSSLIVDENNMCNHLSAYIINITAKQIKNLTISYPDKTDTAGVSIDSQKIQNINFKQVSSIVFRQNTSIDNCIADNELKYISFSNSPLFDNSISWLDDKIDWKSAEIYDLNKKEYIDNTKLNRKKLLSYCTNIKRYKVEKYPNLLVNNLKEFFPNCTFPNILSITLTSNRTEMHLFQNAGNNVSMQIIKK